MATPYIAPEDVQSVLEQFLEQASNLPAELTHLYEELTAKDRRLHTLKTSISQKDASIQRWIRANGSQTPYPKETTYNKAITDAYAEIKVLQDEKCALAKKASQLIERHVKRLDIKIRDLQREGMITEDFITPAMLAPYQMPNFGGNNNSGGGSGFGGGTGGAGSSGAAAGGHGSSTGTGTPGGRMQQRGTGGATGPSGNRDSGANKPSTPSGRDMSTASTLAGATRTLEKHSLEDQIVGAASRLAGPSGNENKRLKTMRGSSAVNPSPLGGASGTNSGVNTPTRGAGGASGEARSRPGAAANRNGPQQPPKSGPVRRLTAQQAPTVASPNITVKKQKNDDDAEEENSDSDEEEEDAGEDQKPYCICQQVSFGNMVACDNKSCPFEWFHWGCVGLTKEPVGSWFCEHCTKNNAGGGAATKPATGASAATTSTNPTSAPATVKNPTSPATATTAANANAAPSTAATPAAATGTATTATAATKPPKSVKKE